MIEETIAALNMHFHRAQKAYEEIIEFKDTLSSDTFEDFENVKSIDTLTPVFPLCDLCALGGSEVLVG
jgi:hypothetical protein